MNSENTTDALFFAVSVIIFCGSVTILFASSKLFQKGLDLVSGRISERPSIYTEYNNDINPGKGERNDTAYSSSEVLSQILSFNQYVTVYVNGSRIDSSVLRKAVSGDERAVKAVTASLGSSSFTRRNVFAHGMNINGTLFSTGAVEDLENGDDVMRQLVNRAYGADDWNIGELKRLYGIDYQSAVYYTAG